MPQRYSRKMRSHCQTDQSSAKFNRPNFILPPPYLFLLVKRSRFLLPYLDRHIGTHLCTKCAAGALAFLATVLDGIVSALVEGRTDLQQFFHTCAGAKFTSFAEFDFDNDFPHICSVRRPRHDAPPTGGDASSLRRFRGEHVPRSESEISLLKMIREKRRRHNSFEKPCQTE